MHDADCVAFLQWALPRLGMRWPGFRKVRRQVCRRVARRLEELGLSNLSAYRRHLEVHPEEWSVLDGLCRITISRFFRDRGAFEVLRSEVVPSLAVEARAHGGSIRAWTAGCASGEEPYTLRLIFDLEVSTACLEASLDVLATDADPVMLDRARRGCYSSSTLRELPRKWIEAAFEERDGALCLLDEHRAGVRFMRHDVRDEPPQGPFDLILCRNLAFTYFDAKVRDRVLDGLLSVLRPGGFLMVGKLESPPARPMLLPSRAREGIWRKAPV